MSADIKAFEEIQEVLAPDTELDVSRQLDPEETMLVSDPEDLPPGDETIVVKDGEEEPWRPTHVIGGLTVMQKQFANGLLYWVEENGKRRRPTAAKPLRKYVPPPAAARQMFLGRAEFALLCSALLGEDGWAEDLWGNVAQKVDDQHVQLSIRDGEGGHTRYLIQVPTEIEVAGAPL